MLLSPDNRLLSTVSTALGISFLCLATQAVAQGVSNDPFVAQVHGNWQGEGQYEGNTLILARSWTLVLQDQFLRADMRVEMPNGASFGALMYWKSAAPNVYDIVWMDGIGRIQTLTATRDSVSGLVSTTFLDELADDGPEWRTWEFESLGADAYVERLYKIDAGQRMLLTVFSFERSDGS